jgi:undecaprenyl-diphosphatase
VTGNDHPSDQDAHRSRARWQWSVGRHPSDVVRLLAAACVVTLCSLLALIPAVNPVEIAIFAQLGELPVASRPVWVALSWVGSWAGIVVVSGAALYLKRISLGLQSAAAGALAWGLAELMHGILGTRPVPAGLLADPRIVAAGLTDFSVPASSTAIAAALCTVAGPYLGSATRMLTWAVTLLVGLADVALGTQLPLDVFAGVFLGWGVAVVFRLVWGAPGRRTSEEAVQQALDVAGLEPVRVVAVAHRDRGPLEFAVDTACGDVLRVKVVRRLHRRAGRWHRLRRMLASLDTRGEPRLSSTLHEADHEAFVALLAERAGVRTPSVVLACRTEHGPPLLVLKQVTGRRLTSLAGPELDDTLLAAIWGQVAALADARIAHHDLRAANIFVDTRARPWLLDFSFGEPAADTVHTAQELAEVLVSLASVVGVERTVASACQALPVDRLESALVYLQPLALRRRIRVQLRGRLGLIELRETLADRIGRPLPSFRSPVRPATVAGLLLGGAAVYLLLPQLTSLSGVVGSLREADWTWLAVATATGFAAIVLSGISIQGSSRLSLPFWRTVAVQLAAAFTGRTTPGGIGFFGINIAYLERLGVRRAVAAGVTVLNLAATGVVAAVVCVVGILGVGGSGTVPGVSIPTGWPVLFAVVGIGVVLGVVVGSPVGRRRVLRPTLDVAGQLWATVHDPLRAVQLFGGSLGYLVCSAFGLAASLAAFQPHFPLLGVLTVFVIGQTLGHLVPVPGGLGAVEAVTIAGLTTLGVASTTAVAAVLTSRLLTYWLPVLPGIAIFRYLQHHAVI